MTDLSFTAARDDFADAVTWVARSLPSRPVTPVLGGVRIDADAERNRIQLSAYDYELSAQIDLDAEVGISGSTLVSGRLLAAIARALPRKPVAVRGRGTVVQVDCGAAEFSLPTMFLDDYPALPILPETSGTVDAKEFAEAAGQVGVAVSRDEATPFLCAVNVELTTADTMTLIATDKHRIVMRDLPWEAGANAPVGSRFLVHSRAVAEMARMEGEIHLAFGDDTSGVLGVHTGNRRTTTRLLDYQYPDCRRIFPAEYATAAVIDVAEFAAAMSRAMLLDDQEFPRVQMQFDGSDLVHLSGGKADIGGVREEVGVEFHGEPLTIWLNPRYLLDGLNTIGADKALLMFNDPLKPLGLMPYSGSPLDSSGPFPSPRESYSHIIMPTRGA